MNKSKKMIFIITVIGALFCFISSVVSLSKADNLIAAVAFGLSGLFCLSNAAAILRKK